VPADCPVQPTYPGMLAGETTFSLNPNGTPSLRAVMSVNSLDEDPVWTPAPPP
jgi:hypothetical protein